MAGRVAAVSKRSMAAAVRERFGFHFQVIPLGAEFIIDTLLLTAELGGAAIAVKMLTGIGFQWWVLPAGFVAWLVLWFGNFSVIEDGVGLLGMVTLSFVVAAWRLHPDVGQIARGFVPSVPSSRRHPIRVPRRQHRRGHGESVLCSTSIRPARSRRNGRSRICGSTG